MEDKYFPTLLAVGIALLLMIAGKIIVVQGDNPCPAGQVPITDASGNIQLNPDGSPQCRF